MSKASCVQIPIFCREHRAWYASVDWMGPVGENQSKTAEKKKKSSKSHIKCHIFFQQKKVLFLPSDKLDQDAFARSFSMAQA